MPTIPFSLPSTSSLSRLLYLSLYLILLPYELLSLLGFLHPAPSLRPTLYRSPACHGASLTTAYLGPWAPYFDVCASPTTPTHSGEPFTQLSAHERNLDFNSFLYAEGSQFFTYDSGPACLLRHFGTVGKFAYKEPEYNDQTRFYLEVDGVTVVNGSLRELFLTPGGGGGSASSPLHPTLTYAMEGNASLLSGWQMQAPFCAQRRLRLSYSFGQLGDAAAFPALQAEGGASATDKVMAASSACIWEDTRCPLVHYNTISGLRFPGGQLPLGWAGVGGTGGALALPPQAAFARAGLSSQEPGGLWSATRLLRDAESGVRGGGSSVGCGSLQQGGPPLVLLDSPAGRGGGVVTALTFDFPTAKHLLHSKLIRLEACWDEACSVPFAIPLPPPTTSATWPSPGWSDARPPTLGRRPLPPSSPGGRLTFDMEALLGPTHMHTGRTPTCRKELYYMGELPPAGSPISIPGLATAGAGAARSGFYLTLPMPFWRAARLQLVYDAEPGAAAAAAASTSICWSVALTRGATGYHESASAYLQGSALQFDMSEGMPGNVLAEAAGQRGSLMLLSLYAQAAQKNFVEGDIRVWSDGSPTPVLWDSGFEDFFQGSHAYERLPHSCGQPFYAWDRAEPPGWNGGCPPLHPPCDMHFFQTRALLYDAVPFRDAFRVALEGNPRTYHARVRAAALWYGAPAQALVTTDWVLPGEEEGLRGGSNPHAYTLHSPAADTQEYSLAATIPSLGEAIAEEAVEGVAQGWPAGGAYPSPGGQLLSLPRLFRLGPGALVSFSAAIHPSAAAVHLRRLVDTRVGVQSAVLWANGQPLGPWVSSDRHYGHLSDSSWKVETLVLPRAAVQGRARVNVTVQVAHDELEGALGRRVYPPFHHGPGWTEARWQVLCVVE